MAAAVRALARARLPGRTPGRVAAVDDDADGAARLAAQSPVVSELRGRVEHLEYVNADQADVIQTLHALSSAASFTRGGTTPVDGHHRPPRAAVMAPHDPLRFAFDLDAADAPGPAPALDAQQLAAAAGKIQQREQVARTALAAECRATTGGLHAMLRDFAEEQLAADAVDQLSASESSSAAAVGRFKPSASLPHVSPLHDSPLRGYDERAALEAAEDAARRGRVDHFLERYGGMLDAFGRDMEIFHTDTVAH
jgi:hypothetical protein